MAQAEPENRPPLEGGEHDGGTDWEDGGTLGAIEGLLGEWPSDPIPGIMQLHQLQGEGSGWPEPLSPNGHIHTGADHDASDLSAFADGSSLGDSGEPTAAPCIPPSASADDWDDVETKVGPEGSRRQAVSLMGTTSLAAPPAPQSTPTLPAPPTPAPTRVEAPVAPPVPSSRATALTADKGNGPKPVPDGHRSLPFPSSPGMPSIFGTGGANSSSPTRTPPARGASYGLLAGIDPSRPAASSVQRPPPPVRMTRGLIPPSPTPLRAEPKPTPRFGAAERRHDTGLGRAAAMFAAIAFSAMALWATWPLLVVLFE
ncbi:hypothetical protein HY734_02980 [Candidatus Uhrbacteria bacterium]|nr:hypothetical protein [Candidatus Uhrbacteria bacterium]